MDDVDPYCSRSAPLALLSRSTPQYHFRVVRSRCRAEKYNNLWRVEKEEIQKQWNRIKSCSRVGIFYKRPRWFSLKYLRFPVSLLTPFVRPAKRTMSTLWWFHTEKDLINLIHRDNSYPFFIILVSICCTLYIFQCIYRLFFHPICSFPGPRAAAISTRWVEKVTQSGWPETEFERLHKFYCEPQFPISLCKNRLINRFLRIQAQKLSESALMNYTLVTWIFTKSYSANPSLSPSIIHFTTHSTPHTRYLPRRIRHCTENGGNY